MPSPFPGMDPYLEHPGSWPDFHHSFITYWCDALADALPANYEARIDERVNLEQAPWELTKQVPLVIMDPEEQAYIKILHLPDRRLVSVLELLSPTNKEGTGRADYLIKRNALLKQDVHLVELDLLVGGHRLPMRRALPSGDYYAFVSRWERRPNCEVYAWTLRQALPTIRIPPRAPDPDIQSNLAEVFQGPTNEAGIGVRFATRKPPWRPLSRKPSAGPVSKLNPREHDPAAAII